MLIVYIAIVFSCSSFAQYYNAGYVPINVQGYMVQTDTRTPSEIVERKVEHSRRENSKMMENLQKIQKQYSGTSLPYSEVIIPADDEVANSRVKGYTKTNGVKSIPEEISTNIMKKLCNDMGFNEDNQRSTLEFYSCVSDAMKTKFTEESLRKTKYHQIDSNIVNILKSNTFADGTVENLLQYQELLSQRNKMDCLNQDDYFKCAKAIVEYKQCYNKVVDTVKIEHNRNKIVCYVKTGLRFPEPDAKEERVRDAYFGVCVHLIEKDLKQTSLEMNAKCNEILTKNNLMHLSI